MGSHQVLICSVIEEIISDVIFHSRMIVDVRNVCHIV